MNRVTRPVAETLWFYGKPAKPGWYWRVQHHIVDAPPHRFVGPVRVITSHDELFEQTGSFCFPVGEGIWSGPIANVPDVPDPCDVKGFDSSQVLSDALAIPPGYVLPRKSDPWPEPGYIVKADPVPPAEPDPPKTWRQLPAQF